MHRSLPHSLRALWRTPGFTIIAVLTLALGIGLNTAMFSVINALILRPLPFRDADRIFRLDRTTTQERHGGHAPANGLELQRDAADVADLSLFCNWGFILVQPGRPAESLPALRVTPNFFRVLGVEPLLGRGFLPDEDQPGKNRVVVLSYRAWQSHFNGDASAVGRVVRLDGDSAEIIGVLPPVMNQSGMFDYVQLYRPLGLTGEERASRSNGYYSLIGRYKPGVSSTRAQAAFDALAARLAKDYPKENGGAGLHAISLQQTRASDMGKMITTMLLGLSGFVLLIACANLANLFLARALARAREYAICGALGASRWQLVRPLLAECLILGGIGGSAGLLLNLWVTSWLESELGGPEHLFNLPFDGRVLGFALVLSLLTSVAFGVIPAWLISRIRVNDTLKSGGRSSSGGRTHHRLRQALIVGQFALALVLLTGAAFYVRGVNGLLGQHIGWNPSPLVQGMISMPSADASNGDKIMAFYQEAQRRFLQLPGVVGAAVSLDLPYYGFKGPRPYVVSGRPPPPAGQEPVAYTNAVSPEYFDVVGTHLLRGRGIKPSDTRTSAPVVVINETMARTLFPDGDAVGKQIAQADEKTTKWAEVVGVAEDVKFIRLGKTPTAFQVYLPLTQETWGYVAMTVKVADPAAAGTVVEPMRRVIAGLNPDLPFQELQPVLVEIALTTADLRVIRELLVSFGALGLLIAALGVYGVMSRVVAQRTSEIGIRMALGAQVRDVVQLILGAGMRMLALGGLIGVVGSIALARFLLSAMPGLATSGAVSIALACAFLIAIALLACWIPARRATHVDPLEALRAE